MGTKENSSEQVAIVTGASRGIGRAIALRLAADGTDVLVLGNRADLLESLVAELDALGRKAMAMTGDVADPEVAKAAVTMAARNLGRVRTLVNNAGVNLRVPTLEMALEDWQRVIDVNLNGTLHFCRAVLPRMVAQGGGAIVNISSTTAKVLSISRELPTVLVPATTRKPRPRNEARSSRDVCAAAISGHRKLFQWKLIETRP